jgi:hypothetical protein
VYCVRDFRQAVKGAAEHVQRDVEIEHRLCRRVAGGRELELLVKSIACPKRPLDPL